MNGRERLLAALDGVEPDRVPRALAFYRVDLASLVPEDVYRDDLVDIRFVLPPLKEKELAASAVPYSADTRLGNPGRWPPTRSGATTGNREPGSLVSGQWPARWPSCRLFPFRT